MGIVEAVEVAVVVVSMPGSIVGAEGEHWLRGRRTIEWLFGEGL